MERGARDGEGLLSDAYDPRHGLLKGAVLIDKVPIGDALLSVGDSATNPLLLDNREQSGIA
jgi:hypothetical protein